MCNFVYIFVLNQICYEKETFVLGCLAPTAPGTVPVPPVIHDWALPD